MLFGAELPAAGLILIVIFTSFASHPTREVWGHGEGEPGGGAIFLPSDEPVGSSPLLRITAPAKGWKTTNGI